MTVSIFDIFKIGIGPSSSHTMGPMRAAQNFVADLAEAELLGKTARIAVQLYGSLALTGRGHCTDVAILAGLEGNLPDQVLPEEIEALLGRVRTSGLLRLAGTHEIPLDEALDVLFLGDQVLPHHPNGMRFTALDASGERLASAEFYSIGGGFITRGGEEEVAIDDRGDVKLAYPFHSGAELLSRAEDAGLSIASLMLRNETAWRSREEVREGLLNIWDVMKSCIERGLRNEGLLPGRLKVQRRAPMLLRRLQHARSREADAMDWVDVFALAVNEENAAGGRVVTAPTNGAAGVIPAVINYYRRFVPGADDDGILHFLLTAGAIGILYKENASISGAEMGCQGEVGVACSMAAGGLVAAQGGSNAQIENAAEIGMEHNLGLTCDPIAGLVQVPCIERNAMGAVKAINAARLAMFGDGRHVVSLDQVIATMRQTGRDMSSSYKETSKAGLAVNVPEC
jgi:L-serine dehydratase